MKISLVFDFSKECKKYRNISFTKALREVAKKIIFLMAEPLRGGGDKGPSH